MSTTIERPNTPSFEPTDPPEFDLEFLVDEENDPTELTVFSSHADDITTHWITVNIEAAIPIQDGR